MCISSFFTKTLYFILCCLIIASIVAVTCLFNQFKSPSSIETPISHIFSFNNTPFKRQLFNERLASYNIFYNDSFPVCSQSTIDTNLRYPYGNYPKTLKKLREQIPPYPKNHFQSRGIIMTAASRQLKYVRANLKLMALTETKLPIEIWYSSGQASFNEMVSLLHVAPTLNLRICGFDTAECRTLTKVSQLKKNYIYPPRSNNLPRSYPHKPAAILSSTFAEVLLLDYDAYLMRDPEELFLTDPMYLKFGALFFPDGYKTRQRPAIWKAFDTCYIPDEYELDSAMILVDKRRVWEGLYMTKLMNDDHSSFYRYISDGDKDTFRFAFRYMKIKYYLVMVPCSTGSFDGTYFCGFSLCKTDSLAQHVYVNHIHKFKYEKVPYSAENIGYTRIGIGDPNNHSFYFHHCKPERTQVTCFHIVKKSSKEKIRNGCYDGSISLEEIEDHQYAFNESLLSDKSRDHRVIMTKTNNILSSYKFVESFIEIQKTEQL